MTLLMLLRIVHVMAAVLFVGAAIFTSFLVRPTLRLVPPASAAVIAHRLGTWFAVLGWVILIVLPLTGVGRLYLQGMLGALISWDFYTTGYGRGLAIMIVSWLATSVTWALMTLMLRQEVMTAAPVTSNPGPAAIGTRRGEGLVSSARIERLQLAAVISSTIALIAGSSVLFGGLF